MCSNLCKCVGCKNFEESADRKTLLHLADAAEVRAQQQNAAKTKLSSQIQEVAPRVAPAEGERSAATHPVCVQRFVLRSSLFACNMETRTLVGCRLPYTFITREVSEATCACLLAQAEEAERHRQIDVIQERIILEEFGRCLMQVIGSAQRTRGEALVGRRGQGQGGATVTRSSEEKVKQAQGQASVCGTESSVGGSDRKRERGPGPNSWCNRDPKRRKQQFPETLRNVEVKRNPSVNKRAKSEQKKKAGSSRRRTKVKKQAHDDTFCGAGTRARRTTRSTTLSGCARTRGETTRGFVRYSDR